MPPSHPPSPPEQSADQHLPGGVNKIKGIRTWEVEMAPEGKGCGLKLRRLGGPVGKHVLRLGMEVTDTGRSQAHACTSEPTFKSSDCDGQPQLFDIVLYTFTLP